MATIEASIKNTRHEGLNSKCISEKLRTNKAESLQKTRKRNCEDIRNQWTTYENLQQWFGDCKSVLLENGFAGD